MTIDEIFDARCTLDGGPRNPPGGKPMRLRSTEPTRKTYPVPGAQQNGLRGFRLSSDDHVGRGR